MGHDDVTAHDRGAARMLPALRPIQAGGAPLAFLGRAGSFASALLRGVLAGAVLITLSACAPPGRAIGDDGLRELGESGQAHRARERTEAHLRDVAGSYAGPGGLFLSLVVVHDICVPGSGPGAITQDDTDDYRISCSMDLTAYYGADPGHVADVLDDILDKGTAARHRQDTRGGGVPFTHDAGTDRIVAYYRDSGGTTAADRSPEPNRMAASGRRLTWDTVRDRDPARLIEEPYSHLVDDPPVSRVAREPKGATVAATRRRHGMVFELELDSVGYYKVLKSGPTHTS
ncbi:hypothetical protein ACN6K9_006355 [Streptomyces sp. SAS_267]|uniref:hypothetical protein n=1 Tax=Streptomyces sp. SAS_267 TaxID=3412750 RepID=UPI00403C6A72